MTLTIDLSPTEQARLTAAAQLSGLDPSALAKQLLTEHLSSLETERKRISPEDGVVPEEARIAAIRASRGSMAYVAGVSVDDLHRERQADKEKEEMFL